MGKLRIIGKKSVTFKNAFILHMARPMINLPHYWDKLSHFTNIFEGHYFQKKLLRMRNDKYKYSCIIIIIIIIVIYIAHNNQKLVLYALYICTSNNH